VFARSPAALLASAPRNVSVCSLLAGHLLRIDGNNKHLFSCEQFVLTEYSLKRAVRETKSVCENLRGRKWEHAATAHNTTRSEANVTEHDRLECIRKNN
jgi:hypothetical protein